MGMSLEGGWKEFGDNGMSERVENRKKVGKKIFFFAGKI